MLTANLFGKTIRHLFIKRERKPTITPYFRATCKKCGATIEALSEKDVISQHYNSQLCIEELEIQEIVE